MKKTWTYKQITQIAEETIDKGAKEAIQDERRKGIEYERAFEVYLFWLRITAPDFNKNDQKRLRQKTDNILNE